MTNDFTLFMFVNLHFPTFPPSFPPMFVFSYLFIVVLCHYHRHGHIIALISIVSVEQSSS